MKKICPTCHREYGQLENYCTRCGIELVRAPNQCSEQKTSLCKGRNVDDDDIYCAYCGAPTIYGKKRLEELASW